MNYNADDGDKTDFRFLHPDKIDEFDTLNTLFFEVLALPEKIETNTFLNVLDAFHI
ncbi:MAG: hypothetical protein HC803_04375 [Saprospiraceae bacterium]|nr:hypothetical protein [Saprospiraceae bacterium]